MTNKILAGEGWQGRVRDKLGVDNAYLPDSALEQPDVITIAEENIISMVIDYEAMEGRDKVYLEAAAVAECAIQVCTTMKARLPSRLSGPHADISVNVDWDKRKEELEVERNSYIARIAGDLPFVPTFRVR